MLPQDLNFKRHELEELFQEIETNQPEEILSYITEYSLAL